MRDAVALKAAIPAMSRAQIDKVYALEAANSKRLQVDMPTTHTIHGGIYSRTIMIPAGVLLTGALVEIATTLILSGDAVVYLGDTTAAIAGTNRVMAAAAGRKQAFLAQTDTYLTMAFATDAKTIEEAENQFTKEAGLLMSRADGAVNHIVITGE